METNEGDTPKTENISIRFPNELKGLNGEPPYLCSKARNPKRTLELFRALVPRDLEPQDTLAWVSAIDMAIKFWEELRLRRSASRGGVTPMR